MPSSPNEIFSDQKSDDLDLIDEEPLEEPVHIIEEKKEKKITVKDYTME